MDSNLSSQILLFKSLFKGREDVFAIRWEKGNKSGYMPAYFYDPYLYKAHKMGGGTFQNYTDKTYLKFTDSELLKHLKGEQLIGIYPLLSDNSSWFIAADFDKANWIEECRAFINTCKDKGIFAYLERSRSGKGGHVWVFFEVPYPAIKSRKIFISLLEQSGGFSIFDKGSSFDRLFPNQDFLSGKGLGNLIALPLFQQTLIQGNSCFIDIETLEPIKNQWAFLGNIQRNTVVQLDELYEDLDLSNSTTVVSPEISTEKLTIILNHEVRISRHKMPMVLVNFLKEELNFANSEFIIKKKIGKNTFGTERYFKLVEETENDIIIPRGFIGKLLRFCREHNIDHEFKDKRVKQAEISWTFNAILRGYQQDAMEVISKKDFGVIVAPPGSGKTIIGLKTAVEKRQPTLIIVHRKQLVEQWSERIQTFLGIPKTEIGLIGQGKSKIGKKITLATIQSLSKELEKPEASKLKNAFGLIIVDECHHIPAETFRQAIAQLNAFYLYGLTATPFRKYNDGKLIFTYLGDIITEIKPPNDHTQSAKIIVRNTTLDVPFNSKTDKFETLSKILVHDSVRNLLILNDVKTEVNAGKRIVIITERKEHIESLYQYLKQTYETITLSGEDSETNKNAKWRILKEGSFQILITTGQFFGEGTDLQNVNCLFLVYPFSFEGKLIQYIGRVQRSEITPTIYDYRDIKIDYLNKLFLKRNTYYRKIEKHASLFDDIEEAPTPSVNSLIIDQTVKVLMENLDFRYGTIAFNFMVEPLKTEIEFELENLSIRPEFDVLKPYFSKTLKTSAVKIAIYAEFKDGNLISQSAQSEDLEKINADIIESVKFKFVSKNITAKPLKTDNNNLLTIDEIQKSDEAETKLYTDGQEMLNDILKEEKFKHSKHLKYLAQKHESTILKMRFVLSPFSFVFLLSGENEYHIVLETLDTEEATYLWHIEKDRQMLKAKLAEIDQQLSFIRNNGRQEFLESKPSNFSRIVHDYAEGQKGFISWKDALEERLT